MSKSKEEVRQALKQADLASRRADLSSAERWSKAADRLAAAAERAAAIPDRFEDEEDDEASRIELTRRLTRYVSAAHDITAWERERDCYEANLFAAIANGTEPPTPLRPRPGAPLEGDDYLISIARGQF